MTFHFDHPSYPEMHLENFNAKLNYIENLNKASTFVCFRINNFQHALSRAEIKNHLQSLLGGIPREFSPIPEPLQGTPGYRGCFANLKLGKEHLDIWSDSHSHSGMQRNCPSPSMRCNPTACRHEGIVGVPYFVSEFNMSSMRFSATRDGII